MAKAPDYGSYIPDANDPVYVTQARAAQMAKEQPLYASGQGTPIFNNPGGIDGYVQFNSASSFGGDVGFTYNSTTRSVNILGNLNVGGYLNSKFYTNFANLRISGGNVGEVIFTDGTGNLHWGNLETYLTDETYVTERLAIFQQGNVNFTGGNVSLGDIANLHITGGSANYILSTDGNGNLSWIEETGGGTDSFRIHKGTTSVSIDDTNGNINILVNDEYPWFFNTNGELLAGGGFVAAVGDIGSTAGYTFNETGRDTGMYSDNDGHLKFKTNDKLSAYYTDNDVHLYTKSADYVTTYDWHLDREGNLTLPTGGAINYANGVSILSGLGGGGGVSISDFGEGFSLTSSNKIVTNKLYSTNETQPTQHYRLELDTNGVIHLPDQSIINGSYIRSVPTSYAGLASGPDEAHNEDSWMWVDSGGAYIATMYSSDQYQWNFDNTGNLAIPNNIIYSGSNTRFNLNENDSAQAYLTTVADDTTALWMTETSAELYANSDVIISSNVGGGPAVSSWSFQQNGKLQFPVGAQAETFQIVPALETTITATIPTLVYSAEPGTKTMKATIEVRATENNGGGIVTHHTQVCEMSVVLKVIYNENTDTAILSSEGMVYGVVHTSATPLATFDTQFNVISNAMTITATKNIDYDSIIVKIMVTESLNLG